MNKEEKDWKSLGSELGQKWLVANNLIREIESKMRDFQKKGKFNLEFKNKINYSFNMQN